MIFFLLTKAVHHDVLAKLEASTSYVSSWILNVWPTWHVEAGVLVGVSGWRRGQRDGDTAADNAAGGCRSRGGGGRRHRPRGDGLR